MKITGTAARNSNGHFGKAPPAIRISPQSQIVPSTSPSSMSSTPIDFPPAVTITLEIIDSVLPPVGIGSWDLATDSPPGPFFCAPFAGSCASVLSRRSRVLRELVSVWTTWLNFTGSARAGTAVKRRMHKVAGSMRLIRPRVWGRLVEYWAQVDFIRFERQTAKPYRVVLSTKGQC